MGDKINDLIRNYSWKLINKICIDNYKIAHYKENLAKWSDMKKF